MGVPVDDAASSRRKSGRSRGGTPDDGRVETARRKAIARRVLLGLCACTGVLTVGAFGLWLVVVVPALALSGALCWRAGGLWREVAVACGASAVLLGVLGVVSWALAP